MSHVPAFRKSILLVALLSVLGTVACAPALTSRDYDTHGTRRYFRKPEDLKAPIAAGLQTMGFKIAMMADDGRLIKTARRPVQVNSYGGMFYHQWIIQVEPSGGGSLVRATPRMFNGDSEVRELAADYWKERWQELFQEVEDNLGVRHVEGTDANVL